MNKLYTEHGYSIKFSGKLSFLRVSRLLGVICSSDGPAPLAFPPCGRAGFIITVRVPRSGLGCAPDHGPIPRLRGSALLVLGEGGAHQSLGGASLYVCVQNGWVYFRRLPF